MQLLLAVWRAGSFRFIVPPRRFDFSKPPLCKGRWRGFPRRRDCFIFLFLQPTIPQSSSMTAFGPGRMHSLLPALAKNMPTAYFLNASRPLHKGAFLEAILFILCSPSSPVNLYRTSRLTRGFRLQKKPTRCTGGLCAIIK